MKRTGCWLACLLVAGCHAGPAPSAASGAGRDCAEGSAGVVSAFYRTALVERHVRQGFETHVSPDFIEHKPDIASADREGAIRFLEGLLTRWPRSRWKIVRMTQGGELVAVHAQFTPVPGAAPYAIADFFRVENCLIVEHWDVVAPPPADAANPVSRF